jgi:NAD(P)-dependent dehydrogenase (short-subunit alcohol dehydrogenase family)
MPTENILDKFLLKGKVAWVTGGAGLLGKQFCRTLAQAGAVVVVSDLDAGKSEQVAKEIVQSGGMAVGLGVDVTSPGSVDTLVGRVLEQYGHLDVLVCSAALDPKFDSSQSGQHTSRFEDYPLQMWQKALDVNLTGLFLSAQAAAKPMLSQECGSMIFICSTYGLVAPDQRIYEKPGQPQQYKPVYYSVTKAGVLGLTRYLAAYYAGKDIRVNALTPGGVYNDHDQLFERNYSAKTILGRMAHQDEMNGALLFLASEASSYMTGSNLVVDGGWTAW